MRFFVAGASVEPWNAASYKYLSTEECMARPPSDAAGMTATLQDFRYHGDPVDLPIAAPDQPDLPIATS